jgi:hypothetical protein
VVLEDARDLAAWPKSCVAVSRQSTGSEVEFDLELVGFDLTEWSSSTSWVVESTCRGGRLDLSEWPSRPVGAVESPLCGEASGTFGKSSLLLFLRRLDPSQMATRPDTGGDSARVSGRLARSSGRSGGRLAATTCVAATSSEGPS